MDPDGRLAGHDYLEEAFPVAPHRPNEVGYQHLTDAVTGYLTRISYGEDEIQTTVWTDVHTVDHLPEATFEVKIANEP